MPILVRVSGIVWPGASQPSSAGRARALDQRRTTGEGTGADRPGTERTRGTLATRKKQKTRIKYELFYRNTKVNLVVGVFTRA